MNGPNQPNRPGPGRPNPQGGRRSAILQEIERVEAEQARAKKLTREMHEFFADATRSAASILSQLSETDQQSQTAAAEMNDFLHQTAHKVQTFVQQMEPEATPAEPDTQDTEPKIRFSDHDYLDLSAAPDLAPDEPVETLSDLPQLASLPDLKLAAPKPAPEPEPEPEPAPPPADPMLAWFLRLARDDKLLRTALKAMVKQELMTREEAIAIYPFARKLRR